jgi:hypothetical protein
MNQGVWPEAVPDILPRPGKPSWSCQDLVGTSNALATSITQPAPEAAIFQGACSRNLQRPTNPMFQVDSVSGLWVPIPEPPPAAAPVRLGVPGVPELTGARAVPGVPREWLGPDTAAVHHPGRMALVQPEDMIELQYPANDIEADNVWNNLQIGMFPHWPLSEQMMYWWHEQPPSGPRGFPWMHGLLPSICLADVVFRQQWVERTYDSALDDRDSTTFDPGRYIWPADVNMPGLHALSRQKLQVATVIHGAVMPREIAGVRPPSNMCVYVQAKRQYFWVFRRMADGQVKACKVAGCSASGIFLVTAVESLRHNITTIHEYRLKRALLCQDHRGIDLPLVLGFIRESGARAGADLHLYHCTLIPAVVLNALQTCLF